ncbi:MAG: 50S ribosomal protein L35 [candidate division TM6 bacterium GW2011_GWF2_43_17]|nr:MAG: 50S ribosomal protein L35 [candidate division TM6 bacterium GW2011_GWF2_43_17]HAU30393.1 50S ribosomal protein L35 [Candidatus Dependentiae bacterium]
MAYKLKTHSGARKRFKKLKSGRIKRAQAFRRHLLTDKAAKRKRDLRKTAFISSADAGHLKGLI